MKTKPINSRVILILAGLFSTFACFGQYTQNAINLLAPGPNVIEKSATALNLETFQTAVATAWTNNVGGVLNFPTSIPNPTTIYHGNFGTNGLQFEINSSVNMQNITAGTFILASSPNGTTSTVNRDDYTLTLSLIDTNTGLPAVGKAIQQIGFVMLSRSTAGYPLDLRVTATFSDGTTQVVNSSLNVGAGVDDTFFGFSAPAGLSISSVRLQSFVPGTETPVAERLGWDDFGFIIGESTATPEPQIVDFSPGPFTIGDATNGIHFNALTYVNIDPTNISLIVNSVDVSSQLSVTGSPTNYSVAYNGLVPGEEYDVLATVISPAGTATVSQVFYTITNSFVLYDSHGFTDDTLYPFGPLQQVTDGRATWLPNTNEPPEIVDAGGDQGKVLQRLATGASRADFLTFPAFASGTIIEEFDAFVSNPLARTIDVALQPLTGGTTMASFIAWGEVPGKLAYYDNVTWIAFADIESGWHHVKIINYLSGPAAGTYDVLINDVAVGQKLPYRNAPVGAPMNQFRIQTQNTASIFDFGEIDNLVITAGPVDTSAVLPPSIINNTATNGAIVSTSAGLHFEVVSDDPISAADVMLTLNGVAVPLSVTGGSNHLFVSYSGLTNGNYAAEIQATSDAGVTDENSLFIATDEPWLIHPGDGWAAPWMWTSGQPELRTADSIGETPQYLRLDTTGGPRNFMRQYQSGAVDITKAHYIRWKFRMIDADFDNDFSAFNDRVHFFAHPVSRVIGGTTGGNSWAIMAAGSDNNGAFAGKTFWVFDNVDGSGANILANNVDSHVPLLPDHVYSFEVLVMPESKTYEASIVDETGGASFESSAPHRFRDLSDATHTFLHFGGQAAAGTTSRAFDIDSVSVTQAAIGATLLNPQMAGGIFTFSFLSQADSTYVVQYRDSLTAGDWQLLQTIPGDGTVKVATDNNPSTGTRYYRVITQ